MGVRRISGKGAGVGFGVGCGFGIGWGFGGAPIGILGMGIGGGCGLGVALGWGVGVGYGTQYINMSPEFSESKTHRPNVFQHVQYAFKRLTTLTGTPPPKQAQQS